MSDGTNGGIYQELEMSRDVDPYEVLEPFKKNRKKKRRKSEAAQVDVEPVAGTSSAPQ